MGDPGWSRGPACNQLPALSCFTSSALTRSNCLTAPVTHSSAKQQAQPTKSYR